MEHASIFLEKFKRFGFKDQILKETVINVIKDKFDFELQKSDISLRDGVVRIEVSGPIKSEIFIHKENIQKEVIERIDDPKNFVAEVK
ncbi:MAG: hypothetical protein ACI9GH_000655 [Candidatus Paceibacteria bacterium]|jgi:hypothetical protein